MNNRQNGRRRGRGGQQPRNGQPGNQDRGNRIDNRARGNAAQLLEKYKSLARDAQMQGDRVNTEYYLQFADHYFRVLSESRSRFEEQRPRPASDYRDDFDGDDVENQGVGEGGNWNDGDDTPTEQRAQPQTQSQREERQPRQDRDDRPQRDDRQPRDDRAQRDDRPQREAQPPRQDREPREERQAREPREERQPRRYEERSAEAAPAETPRAPRRNARTNGTPQAAPAEGAQGLEGEPVSERIDVDRLPQGFGVRPEPVEASGDEAEIAPRPRRRAPRRPKDEVAVEA